MTRKQIVVVGTSFAGYTGALELYEQLKDNHDITVVPVALTSSSSPR